MFDKAQVMEFKDAFSIMDTNSDGLVDINDLKITFERLGNTVVFYSLYIKFLNQVSLPQKKKLKK